MLSWKREHGSLDRALTAAQTVERLHELLEQLGESNGNADRGLAQIRRSEALEKQPKG
jgi:hypothetical protein